jgi:16S rRNA (guanine527-N7)-methyltransferase
LPPNAARPAAATVPALLPSGLENALAQDRARAVALNPDFVSRETWARLDRLVRLLLDRQQTMNLVAASTVPRLWTRHVADSLQLLALAPAARTWVDLGSGAGFPGLVIASALADTAGTAVHLVESTRKKAAFLADAAAALELPVVVHAERIEDFAAANQVSFDVVTARAVAPLNRLLGYAIPLLKKGAIGLFHKGQDVAAELTEASKYWTIEAELIQSKTDPHGRIVLVRHAMKR